jgi:hypothetical protein
MKHYKLDQYFEFTFQTQRFDTGAATDADALPTWRTYEENVDSVVANDNCAKRDDDNTAGYYYARGQITAAAGYEVGKTSEVRAAAAVNSVSGAAVVGRFAVLPANVWDALYGGTDKLDVNAAELGGTGQTGHDVGASVNTMVGRLLGTIAAGTHNPQSGDAFNRIGAAGAGLTALGDARLANLDAAISSRAAAGDAMTLTAQTIIDLAAAMEAAIINELDGTAVMQAIADLIASDMTTTDLTVAAIAAATRDVLLDRVLAGNHDLAGSVGKLLQNCDAPISNVPTVDEFNARTVPAASIATSTQTAAILDAVGVVDTVVDAIKVKTDQLNFTGTDVKATLDGEEVTPTAASKTGYALAANGLDSITTTGPAGVAANFREMLVQVWRRFFGKVTMTADTLTTYDDAGTAVATTQTLSDDSTTQTQGKAASA